MFTTIIAFLVVLSILVFAHELGHFWTARKFGVKADEFGFGFPPRLGGIYRDKEGKWHFVRGNKDTSKLDIPGTLYSINWLPLGGFVKIKGEDGDGENEDDSLLSKPIWKRATVMSAGVFMNIVLAMVLLSGGFMIGLPQMTGDLSDKAKVKNHQIQIIETDPDSPADRANLKAGDFILSVDGNEFKNYKNLQDYVDEHSGEELEYQIKRGGEVISANITPEQRADSGRGGIGVYIAETGIVSYPWYLAIWEGIKTTLLLTWVIMVAFYQLIKSLILGQGLGIEIGGPVKIAEVTGTAARMGYAYLINFTALLSINLAILNFLPFPALDGGRILFLIIEKIKGSPVKRELEAKIHYLGFALLMLLVLLVTYNDIAGLTGGFRNIIEKIIN